MSKIKILEIVRDAEGGMKKHVKNLLDLDKNKFDIVLACSRGQFNRSDLKGRIHNLYEISVGDRQSPWALIKSLVVLVRIIKKEKIDIIHAHGMACAITGTIAGIFSVKPAIITTVHNFPAIQGTGIKQHLSNLLSGFFLRFNRRVVTVSRNLGDFISSIWNIPGEKIRVIYNGIDVEEIHRSVEKCSAAFCEFHDPGIAPVTILNIARLIPAKGVDVFLRAAAIVLERISDESVSVSKSQKNTPFAAGRPLFLVAGDGPQMHELKNLACILGIEKNVRFLGFRTDIYDLIHLADMVVLSSRSEGLGISILESLALKKPVIASRVGGIPEIIIHGKTGLLVPPDDPEALAGAMIHLTQNPEEGKKMAFEGYKNLTGKYSKKFMLKEIENLYLDVYQSLH